MQIQETLNDLPTDWPPTASLANLRIRANMLAAIRKFFAEREILEVETPLLCAATVTDPHIQSINAADGSYYLQTSPEYAMKRLLAAGSGPIYQISKAFRRGESGRYHNPEFTMLEWYRPGFDHHQLMDETAELLVYLLGCPNAERYSYQEIFEKYLQINPHVATVDILKNCAQQHNLSNVNIDNHDRDTWLHLLLSHLIEPQLGQRQPTFIYDFPASQAALARIRNADFPVAERFEVYIQGIELANGYHELADVNEQQRRFMADLAKREQMKLPTVTIDKRLLSALNAGFPHCAGIAVGIDRAVMLAAKASSIAEIISFPIERA